MTEIDRLTATVALLAFAMLNALAWVAVLRLAAGLLDLSASPVLLGSVAAATGLAVPLALGAAHLGGPRR